MTSRWDTFVLFHLYGNKGVSLPLWPIRQRWFHTFSPCAEPLGDGHEGMWARFGSPGSIALNWHSRYSGTRYSGTWLYMKTPLYVRIRVIVARVIVALDCIWKLHYMYQDVHSSSKCCWSIYCRSSKCHWSIDHTSRKHCGRLRVVHKVSQSSPAEKRVKTGRLTVDFFVFVLPVLDTTKVQCGTIREDQPAGSLQSTTVKYEDLQKTRGTPCKSC